MKRHLIGACLAMVLAVGIVTMGRTQVSPLCALYTPDNVEWYLFFCYLQDVDGQ